MKTFRELSNLELRWKPIKKGSGYELREGDEVYATLVWGKRGATAVTAEESWIFDCRFKDWSISQVVIGTAETGIVSVVFNRELIGVLSKLLYERINKGTLTFVDGRAFLWMIAKRGWVTKYAWKTPEGEEILVTDGFKIKIAPNMIGLPELPLLIALSRYFDQESSDHAPD